jgi:MSHA pilin protein MshD
MSTNKPHTAGFTLIEVLIFIVVVAAGLAGILSVMNTSVASSTDPLVRKQSLAIAEAMLEEILLKNYANPAGGDTSTTRANFDDVDQYNGYSTSTGIVDINGVAVPGLGAYNISPPVSVAVVSVSGVNLKKVVVTVSGPGGGVTLSGYRGNF